MANMFAPTTTAAPVIAPVIAPIVPAAAPFVPCTCSCPSCPGKLPAGTAGSGPCCHHNIPVAGGVPVAGVPVAGVPYGAAAGVPVCPRTVMTVIKEIAENTTKLAVLNTEIDKQAEETVKVYNQIDIIGKEKEALEKKLRELQLIEANLELVAEDERRKTLDIEMRRTNTQVHIDALKLERERMERDQLTASLTNSVNFKANKEAFINKYKKQ